MDGSVISVIWGEAAVITGEAVHAMGNAGVISGDAIFIGGIAAVVLGDAKVVT